MCLVRQGPGSPVTLRRERAAQVPQRESELLQEVRATVPSLHPGLGKGDCGRVAVFGGCVLHSGAAYFTAISALKAGADLVHIFCEKDAGPVLRSYSPELIVHPVLDQEYGMEEIQHWLPRLHCVVLGPGLGRNQSMAGRLCIILEKVKALDLPIVLDGDGLWHLASQPSMVAGYNRAVITPSPRQFSRLAAAVLRRDLMPSLCPDSGVVRDLAKVLGLTVLHKGAHDVISDGEVTEDCSSGGSPRRCGGQGGLLAGVLATFLGWGFTSGGPSPCVVAAWGASRLVRASAAQAFMAQGRSMTTEDVLANIHSQFDRLYERRETFL